jgi:hypothetical protein
MIVDEEPVTDEDEMAHGGEAHCDRCAKQQQMLYHRWNDSEGDLWICENCKQFYDIQQKINALGKDGGIIKI